MSTADYEPEKNRANILIFANEKRFGNVEFVEETVSGKKNWKERKLKGTIEDLGDDDRLIVPELSRLGRSMLKIMEIQAISRDKSISVYAGKGPLGAEWHYSIKEHGNGVFHGCGDRAGSDFRTDQGGLKSVKGSRCPARTTIAKGPGKSKLDQHKEEIKKGLELGVPKSRIAKDFQTTPANLANWINRHAS